MEATVKKWRRWNDHDDAILKRGIDQGWSAGSVAAATGRTIKSVYERAYKLGLNFQLRGNNQHLQMSDQEVERLKYLLCEGHSFPQACKEMALNIRVTSKKIARQFGSIAELRRIAKKERLNGHSSEKDGKTPCNLLLKDWPVCRDNRCYSHKRCPAFYKAMQLGKVNLTV